VEKISAEFRGTNSIPRALPKQNMRPRNLHQFEYHQLLHNRTVSGSPWKMRCLPYAYIIGVTKSGTSDFYRYLTLHQDIDSKVAKEIHYWNARRFPRTVRLHGTFFNQLCQQYPTVQQFIWNRLINIYWRHRTQYNHNKNIKAYNPVTHCRDKTRNLCIMQLHTILLGVASTVSLWLFQYWTWTLLKFCTHIYKNWQFLKNDLDLKMFDLQHLERSLHQGQVWSANVIVSKIRNILMPVGRYEKCPIFIIVAMETSVTSTV
jgi:hypothetical protein